MGGGVIGPFKCYVIQWGEVIFYREKLFGRVRFNVISIMRRWVGEQGLKKKLFVSGNGLKKIRVGR